MAEIRNLNLSVIGGAGGIWRARVEYDIRFFAIEVSLNIAFWELAAVIERDEQLDEWHNYGRHWGLWWQHRGNADELVKWIHAGTVAPGGVFELHRSFEGSLSGPWVTGGPEGGPEELRPLVYVNPQITPHLLIGEEVSVDIG